MKFCINCANFALQEKLPNSPELGMCTRVDNARDPVTGQYENGGNKWQWAKVVRQNSLNSYCGPEAKFFVEKEGQDV